MDYGFKLVERVAATNAPVTLADAKEHLRAGDNEDDYIQTLLDAAIQRVEDDMAVVLQQATCRATYRVWPTCGEFVFPRWPVSAVASITYLEDGESSPTTLTASLYRLEADAMPPRVVMRKDQLFPVDTLETGYPITATFTAGFEDDEWPTTAVHAIKLLVGHWYLHREAVATGTIATNIPEAYSALVRGGRLW